MVSKLLVVLGATGHQGSAVLNHFLQAQSPSYKLRGLTRNVNNAAAKSLASSGAEMVSADLSNVDSLKAAFVGATHIFANTDSNQFIFNAIQDLSLLRTGQAAAEYGVMREKEHAQNLIAALASTSSIERIIWSSLPSPSKLSNGEFTKVVMFDNKAAIASIFHGHPVLGPKVKVLLNAFYLDSAVRVPELYAPKASGGVYELRFPLAGNAPVPVADIAADEGSGLRLSSIRRPE